MNFIAHIERNLFEGGKRGKVGWSICACFEFFLIAQNAWNHSIIGLIGAFFWICICLYLVDNQEERKDDDHGRDKKTDSNTPTADAVELWLKDVSRV